jgi:signal peptidase II
VADLSEEHTERADRAETAERPERAEPAGQPKVVRRQLGTLAAVAVLTYAADVTSKIVAVSALTPGRPVRVIDGLLQLRLIRNPGAAFGLGVGMTIVFTLISVVVIAVILRMSRRLGSTGWAVTLGLLLGGALGNLTDRLARAPGFLRGHVVDFLELPYWPVFNVADSAIVCAGALMVLLALRNIPVEGRAERR